MDHRVLGPLQVTGADGAQVIFGDREHQLRALVATLLVNAGTPVSRELLEHALWGDNQPSNPPAALRTCVSRARTTLRPAGICLKAAEGAYLARLSPQDLDVGQFRQLRAEAGQLIRQNQLRAASIKLGQALGCWREPALADLPKMNSQRTRLLEQRRADRLTLADILLVLGQHEAIVPDLRYQTVVDPLDARSWSQLMLALDLSGRRSEALEAYSRASEAMRRPPGGPGPGGGLQEVLKAILADQRPEELIVIPAQRIRAEVLAIPVTRTAWAG